MPLNQIEAAANCMQELTAFIKLRSIDEPKAAMLLYSGLQRRQGLRVPPGRLVRQIDGPQVEIGRQALNVAVVILA
jgi:hypothetical protein